MITPMTKDHIGAVVEVHLLSFPGFFLSFLGPKFLRLYYDGIVDYPGGTGHVYLEDTDVRGFVCGTVGPSRFYSYLLRTRIVRFAAAASSAAVRRPSTIPRLLRALFYPSQADRSENSATLTSLAVDPTYQRKGVGSALVSAFLKEAQNREVEVVYLTTDQQDNDQINAFYRKQGFQCNRAFVTPEGRAMNEYIINLGRGHK